ncbi:hypothetical protein [Nocardioides bizhenqiangii]|uniref:Uncharacterized protein n=1 Tax=Nocardioides bizhenqiangii TaxID=3095076 RepID=A0ABZ0ZQC0_9ACTN|nr:MULTISPECIES: hypothetical protein [unclassified Nocardioides]MDZ5619953.1 hypothetical protein [Nocardioides sp. HM23]WQQ26044.1 hypothetical protein SHK19_19020 [Nocardioides sp. HM61]
MADSALVLYTGLLMAVSVGMSAWRLAVPRGSFGSQVDGLLGACLVVSGALFVSALLPGAQLP